MVTTGPATSPSTRDGRQVVYDWQMASVGPGVLDLFTFVTKSRWTFGALPVEEAELVDRYRAELAERTGERWSETGLGGHLGSRSPVAVPAGMGGRAGRLARRRCSGRARRRSNSLWLEPVAQGGRRSVRGRLTSGGHRLPVDGGSGHRADRACPQAAAVWP